MDSKRPKIYPIVPGFTTGALWHLAAASILSQEFPTGPNPYGLDFIPTIVVNYEATLGPAGIDALPDKTFDAHCKRELKKQYTAGNTTFNFLKDVNVPCLLIVVMNTKPTASILLQKMWPLIHDDVDIIFHNQQQFAVSNNGIMKKYEALNFNETAALVIEGRKQQYGLLGPDSPTRRDRRPDSRITHYHTSTTVTMMPLLPFENAPQRLERLQFLQRALNPKEGVTNPEGEGVSNKNVQQQAEVIVDQLFAINDRMSEDHFPTGKIILYNNTGDLANSQTGSTPAVFYAFLETLQTLKLPFRVIIINTSGPDLRYKYKLDLFQKKNATPEPGIDPLVTCRFFHLLSKLPDLVFGMFSSRSASCDVAAYNGFNCFFWDHPFLEIAAYQPATYYSYNLDVNEAKSYELKPNSVRAEAPSGWLTANTPGDQQRAHPGLKDLTRAQLSQTYRTLQQCLIMGVGLPENRKPEIDQRPGTARWSFMRRGEGDPFLLWLLGQSSVTDPLYPRCPRIPCGRMTKIDAQRGRNGENNVPRPESWLFTTFSHGRDNGIVDEYEAFQLPEQWDSTFEARSHVRSTDPPWSIRADALGFMGYRVEEPKKSNTESSSCPITQSLNHASTLPASLRTETTFPSSGAGKCLGNAIPTDQEKQRSQEVYFVEEKALPILPHYQDSTHEHAAVQIYDCESTSLTLNHPETWPKPRRFNSSLFHAVVAFFLLVCLMRCYYVFF